VGSQARKCSWPQQPTHRGPVPRRRCCRIVGALANTIFLKRPRRSCRNTGAATRPAGWTMGRITALVIGALRVLVSLGLLGAGDGIPPPRPQHTIITNYGCRAGRPA
jgi:hypothetical protein